MDPNLYSNHHNAQPNIYVLRYSFIFASIIIAS
ncbi:hypothetical protein Paride_0335 [Pseudomonas phage Paride]|nr:hypothetical protein Paride_0335 [Pseudomonas phage Paride]